MKQMRGTEYLSACRQTVSDCGCTPATASNTATAPSSTRRLRSTSAVKSTCPGVSIMLIWMSRHSRGRGRCDRDAAFLFLLHPVHNGGALMNFAQLVRLARVIQNPLSRGGLTGIDMSRDADISHPLERGGSSHAVLS